MKAFTLDQLTKANNLRRSAVALVQYLQVLIDEPDSVEAGADQHMVLYYVESIMALQQACLVKAVEEEVSSKEETDIPF